MLIFHIRAAEKGIAPPLSLIGILKNMFLFETFITSKLPFVNSFKGGIGVCVGTQFLRVATTTYCEQVFGLTQFLAMTCSCHTDSYTGIDLRRRGSGHKSEDQG